MEMNEKIGRDALDALLLDIEKSADEPFPGMDEMSVSAESDEIFELGGNFDFEGYQVVRREFFAHLREPSVTFNDCKFAVNKACLNKFPSTEYIQVLVDREKKILALRPSAEEEKDAYVWCNSSGGKRKPRAVTCRIFFAKMVDLMGWNPDYRYKMLGRLVHANEQYLLLFDLNDCEVYKRTLADGDKPKKSKTPIFPAGWQDQFGLPYYEHQRTTRINVFDGYAVYAIKDPAGTRKTQAAIPPEADPAGTGENENV